MNNIQYSKLIHTRSGIHILAIAYSWFSILSLFNLIVAFFIRMKWNDSIGSMLPFSALVIGFGFFVSIIFWILDRLGQKQSHFIKWFETTSQNTRLFTFFKISLLEVLLALIIIFGILHIRLFGRAYIGITPALFLIFSFSLFSLLLLLKKDIRFANLVEKTQHLSLQEIFLIVVSIIGCSIVEITLSNKVFILIKEYLGSNGENWLVISLYRLMFIFFFVNLLLLIIRYLPLQEQWLRKIFIRSQSTNRSKLDHQTKIARFFPPVWISLLISLVFFTSFFIKNVPGYDTNDDITMISILSGYFNGFPIEFPVFSNVLLGHLFKALFLIRNDLNWVVYFYILVIFCSSWCLIFCILKLKTTGILRIVYIGITLLFISYFLSNITFTTIASTASLAGLCIILWSVNSETSNRYLPAIFGILLITIGSLIRLQSTLLVLAMFSPFLLVNNKSYILSKRAISVFFSLGVLLIGCFLYNQFYVQSNPDWSLYYQYNRIRHQLSDTPRISSVPEESKILKSISWSSNDVQLFRRAIYLDESVYSAQNYQTLIDQVPNWKPNIVDTFVGIKNAFSEHPWVDFLLLGWAAWLALILSTNSKRILLSSIILVLTLFTIFFVLSLGYKLPPRVIVSLLLSFSVLMFFLPDWIKTEQRKESAFTNTKYPYKTSFILFLLAISLAYWPIYSRPNKQTIINLSHQSIINRANVDLTRFVSQGLISQDALFLSVGNGYPLEYMDVFNLYYPPIRILTLGWNSFSPVSNIALKQHGFDQVTNALIEGDDIYFVTKVREISGIKTFYKEHYSKDIDAEFLYLLGKSDISNINDRDIAIYQIYEK